MRETRVPRERTSDGVDSFDFVELTYQYPLSQPLPEKEDYFSLPVAVAEEIGLTAIVIAVRTGYHPRKRENVNGVDVLRTSPFLVFAHLLKNKPVLVHGHSLGFIPSTLAPLVLRRYVLTPHIYRLDLFPAWKINPVLTLVRKAEAVIALTEFEASQFRKLMPDSKVHVIPHAINTDLFTGGANSTSPSQYGIPPTENLIICVANLQPRKNFETLIRAFSLVRKEFSDAELVIAGGQPPTTLTIYGTSNPTWELQSRLESLSAQLRVRNHVHFIGHQNGRTLAALYSHSRVFALSSRIEGQLIAAGEAAASGVPLALSNLEPLREIYDGCALFHNPEDHDTLASNIRVLLRNPHYGWRLGQMGKEKMKRYRYDKIRAELRTLYETVLSI